MMTRLEEKLYFQSVFDAIDEVYQLNKHQTIDSYEERLRSSINKLIVPDWFNPDYTSNNVLRKSKSHGQVPRNKQVQQLAVLSSNLSHEPTRQRCCSHTWSERLPQRQYSAASSCDSSSTVIIAGARRSANINGASTYAPGFQRVSQSSHWYKPEVFAVNRLELQPISSISPDPMTIDLGGEWHSMMIVTLVECKEQPTRVVSHSMLIASDAPMMQRN
jgi:hypothetical protein